MDGDQYMQLPGPTNIPERVQRAMMRPMINHRGAAFREIMEEVLQGIKQIYRTQQHLLIYPASGTGGLEAAVANFIAPGEKVLAVSIGVFGDRFADIADAFGAQVERIRVPWGQAVTPDQIGERLAADTAHEIKALLITHNETSTGVFNDLQAVRRAMQDHPALTLVDAVSGLAAVELQMDAWGLDVVVSGSQKAFMIPPGLSFMGFSERALEKHRRNKQTNYYWNIDFGLQYLEKGQTPFTPPISLYFGLQEALRMLQEEGLENTLARHDSYRRLTRASIRAMGLKLLAEDDCASPAVTAIWSPEGIPANEIRHDLQQHYQIIVAGGQQSLDNKILRIGHLGSVRELDLLAILAALEITLHRLGYPIKMGDGVSVAQAHIYQREQYA